MPSDVFTPNPPANPLNVLIAPTDLGALSATEVAQHVGSGVTSVIRDAQVSIAPISAGGPGTAALFDGSTITCPTVTASGRLTEATYVLSGDTAIIDAATCLGEEELTPGTADSYGLGVLIADAQTRGASRALIALNGCTVDDGGAGILVALAAPPLDAAGHTLPKGGKALERVADFDTAKVNVPAGAMDWMFVGGQPFAEAPGMEQLRAFTGVGESTPNLAIAPTWLSTVFHAGPEHVTLLTVDELVAGLDVSALLADSPNLAISTGGAAEALRRSAPESTTVAGINLPEATPQALEEAGAQVAADYLRISTDQG
ncbi:glycerate kinase [Corynebacterium tapiri]|uniref:Glycerate kinase n=1 Tax=Corynebacterium tapiri TaxID=1448266 RepID=A0A5C4U5M2_9CORY|nr:glycerate kinase [Corynebacterium tapiri]TNL99343.1 glycerate kinase [Corynebacterium tapiri]